MRNGMSVKEVYDALDQLERIKKSYADLLERSRTAESIIAQVKHIINRTMIQYQSIVMSPSTPRADKLEFKGKISGLGEALQILDNNMRPVLPLDNLEDAEYVD